jgi:hypothetical protein
VPANPELIRNVRAQLRLDRMAAAAAICGVLSVVAGFAVIRQDPAGGGRWGGDLLRMAVWAQAIVLLLGGGFAALQAISREKELNTFDFQRVTRLTPSELTAGKLLGAPAFMYFIALCLVPAAAVGAAAGGARLSFVLAGYGVLLLGVITVHALALLTSLLVERGAAGTGAVLILMSVWLGPAIFGATGVALDLNSVSPFIASTIMEQTSWALAPASRPSAVFFGRPSLTDVLFGWPVHHVFVLVVLYLGFTAWFLLAVVRNIKRDPAVYEIFTPAQALGMALWINLIVFGFFGWSRFAPFSAENVFLGLNASLFFVLGLGMLRNRDRIRRLGAAMTRARRWAAALWPSPYVLAGLLLAGLVPVGFLQWSYGLDAEWDLGLAIFRVAMIAAWVTRDLLFLQWMNLQRGSRPLRRGLLYLIVYYVCVGVVLTTLHAWAFGDPVGMATSGLVLPAMVLSLSRSAWTSGWPLWVAALGVQVGVAALLAGLHSTKLAELEALAPVRS